MIELSQIVDDLAIAFKTVDLTQPRDEKKAFHAGIGPLTEDDLTKRALKYLKETKPEIYSLASSQQYPNTRQKCDLVIPNQWAIEYKLVRPFGDNGKEAEHWSDNILHPYRGNSSSIGDCYKLIESNFPERKAIIVFGFEHTPAKIDIETAICSFEITTTQVLNISLSTRYSSHCVDLIHPYHQQAKIYAWELLTNRQRLHRAGDQAAADGVRGGVESPDPDGD